MKRALAITAAVLIVFGIWYSYSHFGLAGKRVKKQAVEAFRLYSPDEKKMEVTLFFGDPGKDILKTHKVKIYETQFLVNRIKQSLLLLLGDAPLGHERVIPEGVLLIDAYLDPNRILYVDFTEEMILNHKGGTTGEYLTVTSVINTMYFNFPEIRGLKILIDGEERDTISGHINLAGFLKPDTDFTQYQ